MGTKISEISNVFDKIGKQWMLVSAMKKNGTVNTMTASWGGLGFLWNKNVAFVFIRPQRYTKEFVDEADTLSLSFFDEDYRKMLSFMGAKSGRDVDKIKHENLTLVNGYDAPVFKEASLTLVCKKLYKQTLVENSFIDNSIINKCYEKGDYHDMYVVEIINAVTL